MPENVTESTSPKWNAELLDSMRWKQDPVADDFLTHVIETEGQPGARQIFDALIHHVGIDLPNLPPFAQTYFRETAVLPEWADPELIRKGQELFVDYGPNMLALLFFKALPTTYLPASSANLLIQTGRLSESEDRMARYGRRVGETAQFVLDAMTPGNLSPGGKGIATTQKIRLIHASIRNFMPADQWNQDEWQLPINQEDMAMTILTFSVSLIQGLKAIGVEVSQDRIEAFVHTWKVVGHLMGIHPDLQPKDYADAAEMLEYIVQRNQVETEAGKTLTLALLQFCEEMLPGKKLDNIGTLILQYHLGETRAKLLGVEVKSGCLGLILPAFGKKLFGIVDRLEDSSEPVSQILDTVNTLIMRGLVSIVRKAKGAPFDISKDLRAKWDLPE